MNTFLYDSKIVCPVCEREFTYTRVRTSHLRVLERGKDFYTKYDGIEPFFLRSNCMSKLWLCCSK